MKPLLEPDSSAAGTASRPRLLVVGLGNSILMDDGVGVHAVRQFQMVAPRSCLVVEVGTAVLSAVHLFEDAHKIIAFDAMEAGGAPGSVYLLSADDVLNEGVQGSLHELGLRWILQTLPEPRPEVLVIAAEPAVIDFGMDLSPPVGSAVQVMVEAALAIVTKWLDDPAPARMSQMELFALHHHAALPHA